ncbi:MAG: DUF2156 domain-containing protein [Firmicutes bacterium]|nr:DUF2156 domain-containing protein [Bacillota bacterium]
MLNFEPITEKDLELLYSFYKDCDYGLCEYSALGKIMCIFMSNACYTVYENNLLVRNRYRNEYCFDYPVPKEGADTEKALKAIEDYCIANEIAPAFVEIPEDKAQYLLTRYPYFSLLQVKSWCDYVYEAEKFKTFAGRKYSTQRNHINNFHKLYPEAVYRVLTDSDERAIEEFFKDYGATFEKDDEEALQELEASQKMLKIKDNSILKTAGMFLGDKLIGVSLGEICGDMLIIHIEKALHSYEGIYPTILKEFVNMFATENIKWINREDDADDEGLRKSKLRYRPDFFARKYFFEIENELKYTPETEPIKTEALTLIPVTKEGMDEDFYSKYKAKKALYFTVKKEEKNIGEIYFTDFDYRGGAYIKYDIRENICKDHIKKALKKVANFGLYSLHLCVVYASCNESDGETQEVFSSFMRVKETEGENVIFEKEV